MAAHNPDEIVRLRSRAQNPFEAHVWEQALKEAGISCKVDGDYLDAGIGNVPGMQGEIWVHRDDLAAAEEILSRHQKVSAEETEEVPEE